MDNETAKQIADTTLSQLGGAGRLKAMIGMKYPTYDENGTLTFKFCGSKKTNAVRIKLNPMDLYDIEFLRIVKTTCTPVNEVEGVYEDQLIDIFEHETGLYLRL